MENNESNPQEVVNKIYDYAANELLHAKKDPEDIKQLLQEKGIDADTASSIVENLVEQISDLKREQAKKDMLYGALWCVGGTVATLANIGFIFWGAIIFGGIQFFKGLYNSQTN